MCIHIYVCKTLKVCGTRSALYKYQDVFYCHFYNYCSLHLAMPFHSSLYPVNYKIKESVSTIQEFPSYFQHQSPFLHWVIDPFTSLSPPYPSFRVTVPLATNSCFFSWLAESHYWSHSYSLSYSETVPLPAQELNKSWSL